MGPIPTRQGSAKTPGPTPLPLGSKLPSLVAPPLKGRGEVALLKPLLLRGGVGVGSIRWTQHRAPRTAPTPRSPAVKGRGL